MLFFCIHRINKALSSCSGLRLLCRSLIIRPASESCSSTGDEHRIRVFVLSCFLPSSWRVAGLDKNKKRILSYRTRQDRTPGPPVLCSALSSIYGMTLDKSLTAQLSRMTDSYRTEYIVSHYVGRKGVQIPPSVKRKRL